MYIVSKFHDYYDTASMYGIDKTCVYKRSEESVKIERPHWYSNHTISLPDGKTFELPRTGRGVSTRWGEKVEWNITHLLVGFCGAIYPMVHIQDTSSSGKSYCFYSHEEFQEFVDKVGLFSTTRNRYYYYSPRWDKYNVEHQKGAEQYFKDVAEINQKYGEIFHAFKAPVFVIKERSVVLNSPLKPLGFMKVKDPQTAFQDIYMYISGVIGIDVKPMIQVSDKVKAASRGHDSEYSFKKTPGKRGKNRWR